MRNVSIIKATVDTEVEIKRACAYIRVSSDSNDQLNSYANQLQYYTEYIENREDWEMVDIYADEAVTGTSITKRKDFQRMMNDCRRGEIDVIIVKAISRFARNSKESIEAIRELKELGVSVIFEQQKIDTGKMSRELMVSLYSFIAEQESISTSRNLRMGIRAKMARGEFNASIAPYGYRLVNNELVIVPNEAEIVQMIFNEYLSGNGRRKIVELLNTKQRGLKRNASWKAPATISTGWVI